MFSSVFKTDSGSNLSIPKVFNFHWVFFWLISNSSQPFICLLSRPPHFFTFYIIPHPPNLQCHDFSKFSSFPVSQRLFHHHCCEFISCQSHSHVLFLEACFFTCPFPLLWTMSHLSLFLATLNSYWLTILLASWCALGLSIFGSHASLAVAFLGLFGTVFLFSTWPMTSSTQSCPLSFKSSTVI